MWGKLLSAEHHHSSERLAERRRRGHLRVFIILASIFCVLLAASVYGLWQSQVRISRVVIYGERQSLAQIATEAMQGSWFGIIPFNSTFFVPESRIRAAIMAAYPDIAAVSIFRDGLTGLSIRVNDRVPIAQWCGIAPSALAKDSADTVDAPECYFFDANGFVYATVDTIRPVNQFDVYEALATEVATSSPIGLTLPYADEFPDAFDFARKLASFGSPTVSIVFRGDEVDDLLKSGTRITYVLGHESDAFTALTSARADLNLADGSLDYVDLRFDGKVYLKKK